MAGLKKTSKDPVNLRQDPLRIGIFGGTFDPPHVGHLVLAEEACSRLHLDRILWVLTSSPPHKKNRAITPVKVRLAMLKAAVDDNEKFIISRVDIDRPEPHYAVDTVRLLKKDFPNDILVYLMGSDSLIDLPSWYQPFTLVELIDELGVMCRPGADLSVPDWQDLLRKTLPGLVEKTRFIEAASLEIASSEIRKLVSENGPFRYYVHPAVYEYIIEHNLYATVNPHPLSGANMDCTGSVS